MFNWLRKENCLKKTDKLAKQGKISDALSMLNEEIRRSGHYDLVKQKIWLLKEARDYDTALAEIDVHLPSKPNDSVLHLLKGELLLAKKKFKDALESLLKAVEVGGENIWAEYLMGRAHLGLGDSDKASECFMSIVKYDKHFVSSRLLVVAEALLLEKGVAHGA